MDMKFNNCLIISKEDFFPMLRVFLVIIYKSRFNWNGIIYSMMCGLKFVQLYNGAILNY